MYILGLGGLSPTRKIHFLVWGGSFTSKIDVLWIWDSVMLIQGVYRFGESFKPEMYDYWFRKALARKPEIYVYWFGGVLQTGHTRF